MARVLFVRFCVFISVSISVCFVLFVEGAMTANAATPVSGSVSGTWTPQDSPYVATDSVWVAEGDALLIEAGVEVRFAAGAALLVYGRLQAAGAADDSIRFVPDTTGAPWCGIRFFGSDDGCYLRHCSITDVSVTWLPGRSGSGGGVFSEGSSPLISNCTIQRCRVATDGWEEIDCGGGIAVYGGSPMILSNRILDCGGTTFCTNGGGGISIREATAIIEENEIRRCTVHGFGGGVSVKESEVRIAHNVIEGCAGFHYAGAIGIGQDSHAEVFDNLLIGNEVPDYTGGGIYVTGSRAEIRFCTIASNGCGDAYFGMGGGVSADDFSDVVIENCIIWGNTAGECPQIYPAALPGVRYCDVEGGHPGEGNFDADPVFVSVDGGQFDARCFLSSVDAGQPVNSPCIDAADRLATLAGVSERTTRTDGHADMGIADLGFHHRIGTVTEVVDAGFPTDRRLAVSPNPFETLTTITVSGALREGALLEIYDATGRRVRLLVPDTGASFHWDGRSADGCEVAPGIYFARLRPGGTAGRLIRIR